MDSGLDTFTDHVFRIQACAWTRNTRSKVGFPIRKSSDQSSFAAPQGLSQRTTSFIASQRQGIHRMPLRHLIALMIDVRRSAAADPISERPFALRLFSPRACLPNTSDQRLNLKPPWPLNDTIAQRSDMFPLYDVKHPPAASAAAANSKTSEHPPSGGARRDRTDDLMLAKHALSQLSYGPNLG